MKKFSELYSKIELKNKEFEKKKKEKS